MDFEASSGGNCDTIAAISRPTFADPVRLWQQGMEHGVRDLKSPLHAQRPIGKFPITDFGPAEARSLAPIRIGKKMTIRSRAGVRCAEAVTAKVDNGVPVLLAMLEKSAHPGLAPAKGCGNLELRIALAAKPNRPVNLELVCC